MVSKSMRRAQRNARVVVGGKRILAFIVKPSTRRKLIAAAKTGTPPVTAISGYLQTLVGSGAKAATLKQFVGICVRAVLAEEGFEIAAKGVRVSGDPIFRTGSTYQRAGARHGTNPLVGRLIRSLTDDEAAQALELLRNRKRIANKPHR